MTKTSPSSIDIHIGQNLKLKRVKAGKSLQELANVLNVSFQQIQKYERGQNKISSSNLFLLASSLNTELSYFFTGIKNQTASWEELNLLTEEEQIFEHIDAIPNHEITALVKFYSKIKNQTVRKKTLDLLKSLCQTEENNIPAMSDES